MENEVKEPAPKYGYISPEEYFEMEESSEEGLEYYDGYVEAMRPATITHNRVCMNLYTDIGQFLKDKECKILPSQIKVRAEDHNAYLYPDATIFCGEPEMQRKRTDIILNPSVLFEVSSKSTEKLDHTYKLLYYQSIPSIKEYIIIDSRRRFIKLIRKQGPNMWTTETITEPNAELYIEAIGLRIHMDQIYRNAGL
jgi:Uma2 family endonuclease